MMLENMAYVIVHGLNWVLDGHVKSSWITRDDEQRRRATEYNAQRFVVMATDDGRLIATVDAGAFTALASRPIEA